MERGLPDHRISASVNTALMLLIVLVPFLGQVNAAAIDHAEQQRPWGCRTCVIPASDDPVDDDPPEL